MARALRGARHESPGRRCVFRRYGCDGRLAKAVRRCIARDDQVTHTQADLDRAGHCAVCGRRSAGFSPVLRGRGRGSPRRGARCGRVRHPLWTVRAPSRVSACIRGGGTARRRSGAELDCRGALRDAQREAASAGRASLSLARSSVTAVIATHPWRSSIQCKADALRKTHARPSPAPGGSDSASSDTHDTNLHIPHETTCAGVEHRAPTTSETPMASPYPCAALSHPTHAGNRDVHAPAHACRYCGAPVDRL
jgi:hypothetical protein